MIHLRTPHPPRRKTGSLASLPFVSNSNIFVRGVPVGKALVDNGTEPTETWGLSLGKVEY